MVKIRFRGVCAVSNDELERRKPLLKQYPSPPKATDDRLCVVGGGPSAGHLIDEIRSYRQIWAINGTYDWCMANGINATLFTIDPIYRGKAKVGIFADVCLPETIAACGRAFVYPHDGFARGTTSATAVPHLAITLGYRRLTFYGCEGSFEGRTHTFKDIAGDRLWIEANGQEFVTNPQMLLQSEVLAEVIRLAPHVFSNRSGGLLDALVADSDYDVTAANRKLYDTIMGVQDDQDSQ